MGTAQNPERAKEVASLLKQADKLVKEENLAAALELIMKAQSCDPRNLYAMAYEERVKALLREQVEEGKSQSATQQIPTSQVAAKTAPEKQAPPLQYLSNLAVIEAQRSVPVAPEEKAITNENLKIPEVAEKQTRQETCAAAVSQSLSARSPVDEKIEVFRVRASSFFEKKEYNRALDEITRAYLLDPENEKIRSLEEKVREAIEIQRHLLTTAQEEKSRMLRKKEEEERLKRAEHRAAVEQKIASFLSQAAAYSEKKEFNRALDEIARAYLFDPANEKIHSMEEAVRKTIEEERNALATAHHNNELKHTQKEEEEQRNQEEQQRVALERKITDFLARASAYVEKQEYNRALDELTRAYLFDPANEKVRKLEEKIRRAQEEDRRVCEDEQRKLAAEKHGHEEIIEMRMRQTRQPAPEAMNERHNGKREHDSEVRRYLRHVNQLFTSNRLEEALSELAFVIILDPLNEEVLKLEQRIIEKQGQRQQQQLELYQKQLEERQRRRQAIVAAIQMLAKEHKDNDTLTTMSHLTMLGSVNEDIQEHERQMLATQTVFLASCDDEN